MEHIKKREEHKKMGNVKIKTNSGVKMTAPINTAEELDKAVGD